MVLSCNLNNQTTWGDHQIHLCRTRSAKPNRQRQCFLKSKHKTVKQRQTSRTNANLVVLWPNQRRCRCNGSRSFWWSVRYEWIFASDFFHFLDHKWRISLFVWSRLLSSDTTVDLLLCRAFRTGICIHHSCQKPVFDDYLYRQRWFPRQSQDKTRAVHWIDTFVVPMNRILHELALIVHNDG